MLIDISLSDIGVEIRRFDETEEKFVNNLEMRPGEFQNGLILFRVKGISGRVNLRGYRTEEICRKLRHRSAIGFHLHAPTHHIDNLGVYIFGDNISLGRNVFQHFRERLGLYLLALQL